MSVMAELTIFPMDKGVHLSPFVARAVAIIEKSGLVCSFGPMGTIIEGDWDEVMAVVSACFKELEQDSERISLNLKVDYKKGDASRMTQKLESVRTKMAGSAD